MSDLKCSGIGKDSCTGNVTYIDEKGFIYCTIHGAIRHTYRKSRKLTRAELKLLQAGKPIERY